MADTDVLSEHFVNYVARPKSIDEYCLYNDVYKWEDYTQNIVNFEVLQKMEDRSWRENSTAAWKLYRTWKRSVRKSYLTGNAVNLNKAFPSFGANQMPKRPRPIQLAPLSNNRTDPLFHPVKGGWEAVFLVEGLELESTRLAIMDSGCSSDTHPLCLAKIRFPGKLRTLVNPITFDTASTPITCTQGCTVKYGPWDIAIDASLSLGATSLIPIGQRVMDAGMSFFWMAGKKPCMITSCMRYIFIFEVQVMFLFTRRASSS